MVKALDDVCETWFTYPFSVALKVVKVLFSFPGKSLCQGTEEQTVPDG